MRVICGLYTPLPVDTANTDSDINPAKAIAEKNLMALQNPRSLLSWAHAD